MVITDCPKLHLSNITFYNVLDLHFLKFFLGSVSTLQFVFRDRSSSFIFVPENAPKFYFTHQFSVKDQDSIKKQMSHRIFFIAIGNFNSPAFVSLNVSMVNNPYRDRRLLMNPYRRQVYRYQLQLKVIKKWVLISLISC